MFSGDVTPDQFSSGRPIRAIKASERPLAGMRHVMPLEMSLFGEIFPTNRTSDSSFE